MYSIQLCLLGFIKKSPLLYKTEGCFSLNINVGPNFVQLLQNWPTVYLRFDLSTLPGLGAAALGA